jgi:CubicO group peptidase (beta-lactamase class C family)
MTTTTDRAPHAAPRTASPAAHEADQLIAEMVERQRIPGLSVAVVDDRGPLHVNGYGFADLARRTPTTATTSYLWFSLTKLVTATAARQLADLGRLDLDAPVSDLVDLGPIRRRAAAPTVGQLLNHTAGFPNPIPTRWVRPAAAPPVDPRDFLRRQLAKRGRRWHPVGGAGHYSNLGYLVLGEVIAEAAGRPFPDHVTDAILRPAGMVHTGFTPLTHATATPYVRVPRPFGPLLHAVFPRELVGPRQGAHVTLEPFSVEGASYGGLVGTVTDAGRFASLHLADGTIHGRRLLAPTTAREMRDIPARDDRGPSRLRAGLVPCRRPSTSTTRVRRAPRRRGRVLQRAADLSRAKPRRRDDGQHHLLVSPRRALRTARRAAVAVRRHA